MALKLGLVGAGVVAGAVVAGTMTAGAATTPTASPSSSSGGYGYGMGAPGAPGPRGEHRNLTSGTVRSISTTSITVTVSGADKTYAVNADTKVFKDGPAKLTDVKAGDTVHFATSADGKTITHLADGKGPAGGPGPMFGKGSSGTVKSVTTSSITITVDGTDKTYAVNADTKVFKDGPAKLTDVKAGDTVHFATSADGKTITHLADGKGPGPGGGPGRMLGNTSTGTVASVTASSVTITVDGTTKSYAVTSDTKVFKNGPAKLADVKAGDEVRFATSPDGKTITFLMDGKPPAGVGGPRGFGHGPAGHGGPAGYGRPTG